ncbi:MAG: TetR/AcrR family transcriptional regulator, partial [Sphingobium sp.]
MSAQKRPIKRPQTKAERRAETIEQILDEAEYLFSRRGLYGVTLKDVAKRVGVHHTLLNYYFDDKQKLFDAVFERRAEITRDLRMKALDEYERDNADNLTVEGALHTYLDTDLNLYGSGGEGWRNYGTLASQVASTPEWGATMMDKNFDPVVLRLIGIINRALPEANKV